MRKNVVCAAALLVAGLVMPATAAEPDTLKKCQALKDRIERYTDLRRKGGRAQQMDGWKKQLRRGEEEYRRFNCRRYRRELI